MLSGPRLDAIFADSAASVTVAGHTSRNRHDLWAVALEVADNGDPVCKPVIKNKKPQAAEPHSPLRWPAKHSSSFSDGHSGPLAT